MAVERRIVAVGGGGFAKSPRDPLLERYLLGLAELAGAGRSGRGSEPRVCYIPTAAGDRDSAIVDFYAAVRDLPVIATHLSLFRRDGADVEALLLDQDLVWVEGGNTANLLAIWRAHGVDRALRAAWEAGVVLAGASAGSICWFESGTTDSFGPELRVLHGGLGFLPGSDCPHYDGEPGRRPLFHRLVEEGPPAGLPAGYAADDDVALLFVGTELREAVTSRRGAGAYRVERLDGRAVETALPTRYLGDAWPAGDELAPD